MNDWTLCCQREEVKISMGSFDLTACTVWDFHHEVWVRNDGLITTGFLKLVFASERRVKDALKGKDGMFLSGSVHVLIEYPAWPIAESRNKTIEIWEGFCYMMKRERILSSGEFELELSGNIGDIRYANPG